jgi:DNA-binding response OmpR family regulator
MQRILIADDDPETCAVLSRLLRDEGYTVETAPDVRGAVKIIVASRPDLLITDVFMPDLTGWGLVRWVRSQAPALPIIVMSGAKTGGRLQETSLEEGAAFLHKPVELDYLLATVAQLLASVGS